MVALLPSYFAARNEGMLPEIVLWLNILEVVVTGTKATIT
jgi:hypothetical protein